MLLLYKEREPNNLCISGVSMFQYCSIETFVSLFKTTAKMSSISGFLLVDLVFPKTKSFVHLYRRN